MKILLGLFVALLALAARAEGGDTVRHWGAQLRAVPSEVLAIDPDIERILLSRRAASVGLQLRRATLPSDSSAFAADYGFPTFVYGLDYNICNRVSMHRFAADGWGKAEEVDYNSRLGSMLTLYALFDRPLLRTPRWEVDYSVGCGVGYSTRKYDARDNIDNELIGSRWLIFFGAGVHATYRFARNWGVKTGVEFGHHSNGTLDRPNKGCNTLGPMLGLCYYPYYEASLRGPAAAAPAFEKTWYASLSVSAGAKTLYEDWMETQFNTDPGEADYRTGHFRLYAAYALRADIMRRYARRWASGVGVDLFYGTYADRVRSIDEANGYGEKHSPVSVGIAGKHEVFYGDLSVAMSFGTYVFRRMGHRARRTEAPVYECVGLRYRVPGLNGMSVGFNVKAHAFKADLTEVVLSCPVEIKGK